MSTQPTPIPVDPLPARRLRRHQAFQLLLLGMVIFVCGGIVGWGVCMRWRPPPPSGMGQLPPDPPVNQLVDRLRDELLLSEDQVKQVTAIYQERFTALHKLRDEMGPQLKSQYDQLRQQMQKVLTAQQFERWDQRFKNVRDRMLPPPPDHGQGPPHGPDDDRGPPPPDDFGGPPPPR